MATTTSQHTTARRNGSGPTAGSGGGTTTKKKARRTAPAPPPDRGMGEDNPDVSAPLDSLLVNAAFSPLRRFNPGMSAIRLAARLATRPAPVARRVGGTAKELAKVAVGFSATAPSKKDRRFSEEAWSENQIGRASCRERVFAVV